jgi:hypothetical protein
MRFIFIYFISIIVSILIWFGIVYFQIGNHTNSSQWVADVYHFKDNIKISKPKIVIVAGSNGLFGIDSKMIKEAFGYEVLNDCVNAGVELPSILYHAKRVIKKGDIVIMPLEYPLYSYNGEAGEQMIDYIYAREPKVLDDLGFLERFWIFWHIGYDRLYRGYFDRDDIKNLAGVYGVHNVDKNGDQIKTEIKYKTKQMRAELEIADKNPESYGEKYIDNSLGWEDLQEFVQWAKDRDVRVVFVPSTLMDNQYYHNSKKESWFYRNISKIVEDKGFNYVGEPYDYMYPKSLYFNTNFHLINQGREIRTKKLIEDLRESKLPFFQKPQSLSSKPPKTQISQTNF